MKKLFKGLSAATLAAALVALSAPAEAADITCRVPFSFTVSGKTLPPGPYNLSTASSVLFVRGHGRGVVVVTNGLESRTSTDPKLVFHKYGDQYILREAWTGEGRGRRLPEPRLEREAVKAMRAGKIAISFERVVVPAL